MTEAEWLACEDARELLRYVHGTRRPAAPTGQRKLWHFGCAGCRLVWDNLSDERSRAAVEVAERPRGWSGEARGDRRDVLRR